MIQRKWVGGPTCYYCDQDESIQHLFFQCSNARVVWAVVVHAIGADNIPSSFDQCWKWCDNWLPESKQFHTVGIAAICWAIWKTRNAICFESKIVSNPITIICYASSLMCYWAGLFLEDDKEALVAGVNKMLAIAVKLLCKKRDNEG